MALTLNNTRRSIGQQLRTAREADSLTQQQVADRTGYTQQHIARIESGKYNVTLDVLAAVVDVVGMHVALLPK